MSIKRYQASKKIAGIIKSRHPWIYRNALSSAISAIPEQSLIRIVDGENRFLSFGVYEPSGIVGIRLLFLPDPFSEKSLATNLLRVIEKKRPFLSGSDSACRVVNGEADSFPGLSCDVYAGYCVWQPYMKFWDSFLPEFAEIIEETLNIKNHIVKFPGQRKDEGAPTIIRGNAPDEPVIFSENGINLCAYPITGQKTGFYLDLRLARKILPKLSSGKSVLNCFANSGAFSVISALSGAKEVTSVDEDKNGEKQCSDTFKANGLMPEQAGWVSANVWDYLVSQRLGERRFDLIIIDPPNLCKSKQSLKPALKGWKKLIEDSTRLLSPDGKIVAINCSSMMKKEDCEKVFREPDIQIRILNEGGLPPDHTAVKNFPEGKYLKWWVLAKKRSAC